MPFAIFDTDSIAGNLFYDPTVRFLGNNTANRISPLTASELSAFSGNPISVFDRVELRLGGSGGIDNLVFSSPPPPTPPAAIPLPSAAWAGLGLLVLIGAARITRRNA